MFVVTALDKEKGVYKETIKTQSEFKKQNKQKNMFSKLAYTGLWPENTQPNASKNAIRLCKSG